MSDETPAEQWATIRAQFRSGYEQTHAEARDAFKAENDAFILFLPVRDEGGDVVAVRMYGALDLPIQLMFVFHDMAIMQLTEHKEMLLRTYRDAIGGSGGEEG